MAKKKAWYKKTWKFVRNILFALLGYNAIKKYKIEKKCKNFALELKNIAQKNSKLIIVYLSFFDYYYPLQQRPNHIFNLLAKEKRICVLCGNVKNIVVERNNLYIIPFKWLSKIIKYDFPRIYITSLGFPYDDIKDFCDSLNDDIPVIYELFDDFDLLVEQHQEKGIELFKNLIKRKNTFCLVSADYLYEKAVNMGVSTNRIMLSKNGVNLEDFRREITDIPFDMKRITAKNKPIVGYYGALTASWYDFDLLTNIVKEHPEYEFVLIGIKYKDKNIEITEACISNLEKYNNFTYLPPVDYKLLPDYAKHFSVGIIPFKLNDITKACSPVKLFEYMAMGLPIVTTALTECKLYKSCFISNNEDEFSKNLEKAIKAKDDASYQKILSEEANANTWKKRVNDIIDVINDFEDQKNVKKNS